MPPTATSPAPLHAGDPRSVDEALAHWQRARVEETGRGDRWVSIAFEIARQQRAGSA